MTSETMFARPHQSVDQQWQAYIEREATRCHDQALPTKTSALDDATPAFLSCFDEGAVSAEANRMCYDARYRNNIVGCDVVPDPESCLLDTSNSTRSACSASVNTAIGGAKVRHMADLRPSSPRPMARIDCSLPENEFHERCTNQTTQDVATSGNCEGAMGGEIDSEGRGFINICIAAGRPPVRATAEMCASLETPEAQANCRSHFAGVAEEEAEARSAGPLDTNRDGVVSAEERETADANGDGRISDEEERMASERQAANPEQISACDAAFAEASLCCGNPMACLVGGNDATVGNNVNAGIGLVMQGGQMYSGMQQQEADMNGQPSTAMCDFMNTAGTAGAGINAASAAVCMQKKSACNRVCDGVSTGKCNQFNAAVAQSAIQGVSMALAASIANQCANLSAQSNGLQPSDIEFLPDCSDPANSSNPNCNGECSGPDAASNPFCKTGTGGTGNGGAGTSYAMHEASYGDNNANYDSNPDLLDGVGMQENIGFGAEGQSQANAIQGGGGGGMGSGAGGANLGSDGKGKAQGGGYNTNVLKGASGGGGYVGPSTGSVGVSSNGGGFRGYGRARGSGGDDTIDLKQFLPGGKKDPRKRTVAALAGAKAAQIGRKETNIFQTMSVKYRQMCKLKRMWDCPKLSRSGASRGR